MAAVIKRPADLTRKHDGLCLLRLVRADQLEQEGKVLKRQERSDRSCSDGQYEEISVFGKFKHVNIF